MSTITVDHRIRARRVEVARDEARRRHRRLGAVGLVLGLVAAGGAATFSPLLDVEHVGIRGGANTTPGELAQAAGVASGDALAWFDTGAAERAVEALPWVDEANVDRSWSGSVTIEVTERTAVAALATDRGWLLADAEGRVLAVTDVEPADVPRIDGLQATGRPGDTLDGVGRDAVALAAAVPPSLRPSVAVISGAGDDLSVTLRTGGSIVTGGAEDAEAKLAAAAAVLTTVPVGCVDRLDVSVASTPALVRVAGCA